MKPRLVNTLVFISGTLSGASLLIWIASYALGLFALVFSPNNGFSFITAQRGTLAFYLGGPAGGPARSYVWWLQTDEMFDNQPPKSVGRRLLMLPDQGDGPRFGVGPEHYPWRWSLTFGLDGFMPIWIFTLLFAIAPVAWAAGFFDRSSQGVPIAEPKDRNDPTS